jgi:hypothetical protein
MYQQLIAADGTKFKILCVYDKFNAESAGNKTFFQKLKVINNDNNNNNLL